MIRQAISCDICGTEKKQTNHWFVVYDRGNELRIAGWSSRNRLRPGSKHLCGQTCLHKLVDDFMAKTLTSRPQQVAAEKEEGSRPVTANDTSLTGDAAYADFESSARLLPSSNRPIVAPAMELVGGPKPYAEAAAQLPPDEPEFASRNWRIEAWKREREREMRASGRPMAAVRRRSGV